MNETLHSASFMSEYVLGTFICIGAWATGRDQTNAINRSQIVRIDRTIRIIAKIEDYFKNQ